jgi:repressor LexA
MEKKAIERVMEAIKIKGLKPSFVEKELGFSNGYLAKMSKNKSSLGEDVIIKISEYLDFSLNFLLKGDENNLVLKEPEQKYQTKRKLRLPLIPLNAVAGFPSGNGDVIHIDDCEYYDIPEFNKKADYLIRVTGSSMSPKYNSGDIVACKRLSVDTFFQWNKVYLLDTEQGPLIKRIHESQTEGSLKLVSDNSKYPPFDIPKRVINNIAIVIGVIRLE